MGQRLDRDHREGAGGAGHLYRQQADGAAPDDRDRAAEAHVAQVEAVQRHSQRFEQGDGSGAETLRHGVEQGGGPDDVFAHASVGGTMPGEAHPGAEVGVAFTAALASLAGYGRVRRHPAPVQAAALYRAAELVAEDEGPAQDGITYAPLAEPVQIRPAQADRAHAHQALARPRFRAGLFDHLELAGGFQPDRFHVRLQIGRLHIGRLHIGRLHIGAASWPCP